MEHYQIAPWDDLLMEDSPNINLEQYVPPELEKLAYEVCESYDMQVQQMTLITSKPDKGGAIWRIDTNHGARSLKALHRTPERSLFSVGAQEYVVKHGGRVPAIIHTKDGSNSVVAGGKLWIVTDWIVELAPVAKIDLEGSMTLCHGLGEFHQWTKGYEPPPEAGKSSRIFKWESQYEKIMSKISWFRHLGHAYPDTASSAQLLSVLDMFETQAQDIFKRFQDSSYSKMIRKGEAYWGLAHQDYGWSNGQMGPGGIWVIDLDGVAFDLPIRDLRKIITSTMDDMGAWDIVWIRGVIDAYHQANPLDRETFELLWLDMAFPNEFYKHVKEIVFDPVTFMNTELGGILDRVVATEANKWEVLRELELDAERYEPGDYPELEEFEQLPYAYRDFAKQGVSAPQLDEYELDEDDEDENEAQDQMKDKKKKKKNKSGSEKDHKKAKGDKDRKKGGKRNKSSDKKNDKGREKKADKKVDRNNDKSNKQKETKKKSSRDVQVIAVDQKSKPRKRKGVPQARSKQGLARKLKTNHPIKKKSTKSVKNAKSVKRKRIRSILNKKAFRVKNKSAGKSVWWLNQMLPRNMTVHNDKAYITAYKSTSERISAE